MRRVVPVDGERVRVNVDSAGYGPWAACSDRSDTMMRRVLAPLPVCHSAHKPEPYFPVRNVPGKDTGGERR